VAGRHGRRSHRGARIVASGATAQAILSVDGLTVEFPLASGSFRAVDGLSFELMAGRTLAVVGESGSGKSITALSLLRLTEHLGARITAGRLVFRRSAADPIDLVKADDATIRAIRGNDIAMIFQEPMTSLNPVFTVGDQIAEAIVLHQGVDRREARERARALCEKVRLPDAARLIDRHPHQLSGGMRQRVMIAMALSCRPKLLIADEPTTALDVTIQAQILALIRELQVEFGTTVIFITHDMGVVAEMADDVVVMRAGRKVEQGPVAQVFDSPAHAYTKALLAAVPRLGSMAGTDLPVRFPALAASTDGEAAAPAASEVVHDTVSHQAPLLEVEGLTTRFVVERSILGRPMRRVHAVEGVDFRLWPGETLALVGESGSGKSTIGKTIQQLLTPEAGRIRFEGRDYDGMDGAARRRLKREIQYIFQDPFASLDPRRTVGYSLAEPMLHHGVVAKGAASRQRVAELLRQVGLDPAHADRYPHEFSGGQRQRICIARALGVDPRLIIADESVASLDVSIRAQIIDLLMELQQRRRLAYLFITHDMAVVERVSHRVAVMYLGQIVEIGSRRQIFETPRHPYTRKLMGAVPVPDPHRRVERPLIIGEIPSPVRRVDDPPRRVRLIEIAPGHLVAEAEEMAAA
jgi:glutathione transport system ATP-binding protein